ncbi:MAG: E3 ubiquitin ligase family protein [Myxococcota bacterium]|nr:E3 ubiquitin ligase family protein [Myxococcota bacterium]
MQPLILLLVLAGAGAIGLGSWFFSPRQRSLRAIRSVPRVPIAEAVEGSIVRIVGHLRPHSPLLAAPISGRSCAQFDLLIEEHVNRGKSHHRKTLVHETASCDFLVEDETGRALVETAHLEAVVVFDHHQRSGFLSDPTPELESILTRHGHSSTTLFGLNRTITYREGVLEPGELVAVLGRARWEDDPEPGAIDAQRGGYRDSSRRRRLVLERGELGPVRASDDPSALD